MKFEWSADWPHAFPIFPFNRFPISLHALQADSTIVVRCFSGRCRFTRRVVHRYGEGSPYESHQGGLGAGFSCDPGRRAHSDFADTIPGRAQARGHESGLVIVGAADQVSSWHLACSFRKFWPVHSRCELSALIRLVFLFTVFLCNQSTLLRICACVS